MNNNLFDKLYYSILLNEDISDENILYNNLSIAFIPGSFKPPTKSDWDLILQYSKLVSDKVIIIISNISKNDIAKRPLSATNLNRFSSILSEIEQETSIDLTDIKQNVLNNIDNLSYDQLLLIFKKDILPKLADNKIKERIQKYFSSLDKTLFKNVKMTDTNKEITSDIAVEIFKIYANSYGISNKLEFKISEGFSPMQDLSYLITHSCNNCDIYLGYFDRIDTKDRFSQMISDLYTKMKKNNLINNIIEYPIKSEFKIDENTVRNNCYDLKRQWFPDKISDNDFEEIKKLLNDKEEQING